MSILIFLFRLPRRLDLSTPTFPSLFTAKTELFQSRLLALGVSGQTPAGANVRARRLAREARLGKPRHHMVRHSLQPNSLPPWPCRKNVRYAAVGESGAQRHTFSPIPAE